MAYITFQPRDYFKTLLYTGTGSAQSITGVGFQPDLVWVKDKTTGVTDHLVQDAVRGATYNIRTNSANAQDLSTGNVTSFDSDGFSVGTGGYANASGDTFASWSWLANGSGSSNTDGSITTTVSANTTSGFSIVTYTGTGSAATIGHGLGAVPKLVITKNLSISNSWRVYSANLGNNNELYLNLTEALAGPVDNWNYTTPTSSVVSLGTNAGSNGSGNSMVAYCFAEKKGFSKFGVYTGNGNANGTFVYTGFRPSFIIVRKYTATGNSWCLFDNKREGYNDNNEFFQVNTNETDGQIGFSFLSNGFKLASTQDASNASGGGFYYIAFADQPLVTSNGLPSNAR